MGVRAASPDDLPTLVALEAECEGVDAWSEHLVRDGLENQGATTHWLLDDDQRSRAGGVLAKLQRPKPRPGEDGERAEAQRRRREKAPAPLAARRGGDVDGRLVHGQDGRTVLTVGRCGAKRRGGPWGDVR